MGICKKGKGGNLEWIIANWESLFFALTSIVTAASAVANVTKTDADNRIVTVVSKVINALALNFKK